MTTMLVTIKNFIIAIAPITFDDKLSKNDHSLGSVEQIRFYVPFTLFATFPPSLKDKQLNAKFE